MAFSVISLLCVLISVVVSQHDENERVTALAIVEGSSLTTPIALSAKTFADVIKNGNIFIDKTLFIKDILDYWHGKFRLINRPLGWGKSVTMDMIRKFFEIELDEKGNRVAADKSRAYKLFELGEISNGDGAQKLQQPLLISKHKDVLKEHLGQYPILYTSLAGIKPDSLEEFEIAVAGRILEAVRRYDYLKMREKLDDKSKQYLDNLMQSKTFPWNGLRYICQLLEKYFGRKPLILIDDYDEPVLNIFGADVMNETNLMVRSITDSYGELLLELDRGDYFTFTMLTGTIKLTHDNVTVHGDFYSTRDPKYIQYYGVNLKELNMIFDHLAIPKDVRDQAMFYYAGYHMSQYERNVSNPSSIAKFVASRKVRPYFVTHPTIDKVMTLAIENGYWRRTIHRRLSGYDKYRIRYINTHSGLNIFRLAAFLEDPEFQDMYDSEDVFLAYAGGYLTNGWPKRHPHDDYYYEEVVPNEEVRLELKKKLQEYWAAKMLFSDVETAVAAGVPKLAQTYKQFLLDENLTSPELCDDFLTYIHNLPVFQNRTSEPLVIARNLLPYYSRLAYNILNFVALYMDCFQLVDSLYCASFRERHSSAELSLKYGTRALVTEMSFAFNSVEETLNRTRIHRFGYLADYRYPGVQLQKRIGINYLPTRKVEVIAKIVTEASPEVDQWANDTFAD